MIELDPAPVRKLLINTVPTADPIAAFRPIAAERTEEFYVLRRSNMSSSRVLRLIVFPSPVIVGVVT